MVLLSGKTGDKKMSISKIDTSKIKLLGDRVAVLKNEVKSSEVSGLVMPQSDQEKMIEGKVIAIGEGKEDKDGKISPITNISLGDTVLFDKWAGKEIKTDQGDTMILDTKSIIAVLK